ncbi:MAG: type II toxin-antitoxin system HipA family toxin [Alphaproteobacteria bacterium]|nr:type II toxin-antitoxin system HipA family toxin [Alphaproteobacteria bacterium]
MGTLYSTPSRGKEIFSFEYLKGWLESRFAQQLDPDLVYYSGPQYLKEGKTNFGIFMDSAPDRWGRMLIQRKESIMARESGRKEKTLQESDYLLGVYDQFRIGGLRFKETPEGPFLNDDRGLAIPPWTSLKELAHASLKMEDETTPEKEEVMWLNLLLAPGSSLGGARPKAGVLDQQRRLCIAKFPSRNDNKDIGAWEMVTGDLARQAGINMAEGKIIKLSSAYHTYFSRRFDRTDTGKRIHFASAMNMLGYQDGADATEGVSYLDIVNFLIKHGSQVEQDLEELWRRIVFSICVKNTDDHLRNHGFLLTGSGWKLSPAYDINPVETGTGLRLNISENDNSLDLDLAMEVSPFFRLTEKKTSQIIGKVKGSVQNWRCVADRYKILKKEQNRMSRAFRL